MNIAMPVLQNVRTLQTTFKQISPGQAARACWPAPCTGNFYAPRQVGRCKAIQTYSNNLTSDRTLDDGDNLSRERFFFFARMCL